jgi:hypothetical protein
MPRTRIASDLCHGARLSRGWPLSFLVHVQASAPGVHDLHSQLRAKGQRLAWIPATSDPDGHAQRQQLAVSSGILVRLVDRLRAPALQTASGPAAQPELYRIFMQGGDHQS